MNHSELSYILIEGIRDLIQLGGTREMSKLLADTYLTLLKQHRMCTKRELETFEPLEIVSLGTLAHHFSKQNTS